MERVEIYIHGSDSKVTSLCFSISGQRKPHPPKFWHSFLSTLPDHCQKGQMATCVVPISKPRPVLASRLSQYLNYLWFSAILIPSPTLNSSGSGIPSPSSSFPYNPTLYTDDYIQSVGHVQSNMFSSCSGLFQTPLAVPSLISTIKTFPSTLSLYLWCCNLWVGQK